MQRCVAGVLRQPFHIARSSSTWLPERLFQYCCLCCVDARFGLFSRFLRVAADSRCLAGAAGLALVERAATSHSLA